MRFEEDIHGFVWIKERKVKCMKILVTGANGYLGQGVVKQLLDDGNDVIATDFYSSNIDNRAVLKECDIFSLENPFEYFEKPEVVLHLAWRDGFVHNSNAHLEDLPKHYEFLKKMIEAGISKVVVLGSMHEIGFFEGSIKEDTPANPMSLYGVSKNALRNAIQILTKNAGVTFQWLRGYYIVGNSEYGCSIFSKITAAEKEEKEWFPFTMGQNQWDFLDYDETCLQIASAVEQSEITGIINVCSGRPEKLCERVERFIKENAYSIKLKYGAFPDRPYDSKAVWGDDTKIQAIMERRRKE